jgi:ABC-type transporter Mla subunit MlaD
MLMQQNIDQQINAAFGAHRNQMDALHNQILPTIQNGTVTRADLHAALQNASAVIHEAAMALDDHASGLVPLSNNTLATIADAAREAEAILGDIIVAFATVPF